MTKDTVNPKEQGRLKTTEIAEIEKKKAKKIKKTKSWSFEENIKKANSGKTN